MWTTCVAPAGEATPASRLDPKQLSTAKARVALWGGVLHAMEGDDGQPLLIVSRWSLTRAFADLAAVEAFLADVGAAP